MPRLGAMRGRFPRPRWIPACAGMTPGMRPKLVPQPPSSPGLTRGSSRPHRPPGRRDVLDGRVKPGAAPSSPRSVGRRIGRSLVERAAGAENRPSPFDKLRVRSYGGESLAGSRGEPEVLPQVGSFPNPPHGEVRAQRASNHEARTPTPALSLPLVGRKGGGWPQALRSPSPSPLRGGMGWGCHAPARGRFPWPRWIPACAGMTPGTRSASGAQIRAPTTVIPGLDPGIQPASAPAQAAR
jgi:hypothetical protein